MYELTLKMKLKLAALLISTLLVAIAFVAIMGGATYLVVNYVL